MALANFIDKINLSAAQRIKAYDRNIFEQKLMSHIIGIEFAENALETKEGRCALDLTIRIISRLYPAINVIDASKNKSGETFKMKLIEIAKQINPQIECNEKPATIKIYIGDVEESPEDITCIYIGSDNWLSYYSRLNPLKCNDRNNPFGPAGAVCIACANLFRFIFNDELNKPRLDDELCFSVFNHQINNAVKQGPILKKIPVSFTLIGAGAIGNAVIWAFSQLNDVMGDMHIIDKETVAISNLQRYILMFKDHVNGSKVEIAKAMLSLHENLTITICPDQWQNVIGSLKQENLKLIATAIDTRKERLLIQSTLPRKIVNAWTSTDDIGISRHLDFLNGACLGCLYMPNQKEKSESEKIAESLGMGAHEPFLRSYIANRQPIDEQFAAIVHQYSGIDQNLIREYIGQQVIIFYSEAICGGRIFKVNGANGNDQNMEVPLAHESVFAGILLAAEIVIESIGGRAENFPLLTKINLLRPAHNNFLEEEQKHYSGLCICQDDEFVGRYKEKWNT